MLITNSILIQYPIVWTTMANKGLLIWLKRKHLLTIILNLIAWSTVANKVLLVQGKQTILLKILINRKQEMKISTDTLHTLANNNNIYLLEQVKKHRRWNGKLEFLIKWLGYSNHQNTWKPKTIYLLPLSKSIFNNLSWRNQHWLMQSLTNILTKEPSNTWRCHITRPLVVLCLFILWSSLTKAQLASVPALNLGPLYDCSQPQHLEIFGFPSLKNCSDNILQ